MFENSNQFDRQLLLRAVDRDGPDNSALKSRKIGSYYARGVSDLTPEQIRSFNSTWREKMRNFGYRERLEIDFDVLWVIPIELKEIDVNKTIMEVKLKVRSITNSYRSLCSFSA